MKEGVNNMFANLLAAVASFFAGAGVLSFSPNTYAGEIKCPKSLL